MHSTHLLLLASVLSLALHASTPDQNLVAKTRDRIRANQLTAGDRKFDRIAWVPTITEALRLAKESRRPVFLLTYYGDLAIGRSCGDSTNFRAAVASNDEIIDTLNRFFVPVYRSWNELSNGGNASPEERQEHHRIIQEAFGTKLPPRDVRAFVLNPDGHPMPADLSTSDAFRMQRGLLQVVMQLGTKPGEPLVKLRPQSVPPSLPSGALVLHTVARGAGSGSWRGYPAENWTTLSREQLTALLPPEPTFQLGQIWAVDKEVAHVMLTTFYPATEEDTLKDRNVIQKISMKVRVTSIEDGIAIARLDASWSGKRSFYPGRNPDMHIDVKAEGYIRFPVDRSDVFTIALATTEAYMEDEEFTATLEDVKEMPVLLLPKRTEAGR